jgi:tetratricopeptide (TPR) repeat protein
MYGVLFYLLREPANVLELANDGIAIADEHQIVQEHAWLATSRGWALAAIGKVDEGIDEISASLAMRQRMNANLDMPFALSQLADAFRFRGNTDKARETLHQAIDTGNRNHDVWYQSDIYRMLGDVARVGERTTEGASSEDIIADTEVREAAAEASYMRAIDIARKHGARSFELRASVRLGKLMMDTGRAAQAHALVAPIRAFFDGQRETPDSIEADELLASGSSMETQPAG